MLGHDADQVRVGAIHALAGLAQATPSYMQTVIDVLCAYRRRPYYHPAYGRQDPETDLSDFADPAYEQLTAEEAVTHRERQVRLTAQRVLADLLPTVGTPGPAFDLDLTGASLEYLDLAGRRTGLFTARRAAFHGITRLRGTEFGGQAMFTGAQFRGRVDLSGARFSGGLSLLLSDLRGPVDMTQVSVGDFADIRWSEPASVDLTGTTVQPGTMLKLNPGVELG